MKKLQKIALILPFISLLAFSSCKPKEPVDPNEEEVITKVQLTFTDSSNATNTFMATYSDPDGDGGGAPVQFDSIRLDSGRVYNVSIGLYDESDPQNVENITTEVLEESDQHLFCYTASGVAVSVLKTDSDGTFPIGQTTRWTAGAPSVGAMRVELRHQPDGKDGTCNPGSTDVQLDFSLSIE